MGKLLVFGHKNPDTDAIGAALAFEEYLNLEGREAEAVALGSPNAETAFALDYFSLVAPRVIDRIDNEVGQVALVDHNEPIQSVDDLDQVEVQYVVDHHRISGFETAEPLYYRAEPIGSTSSVIFKMFKEKAYPISREIAGMMLSALISDTLLLKSPTCTAEDKEIAKELAEIAGVDLETYGLEMLRAGTNLKSRTDEDLINGDAKNFDMHGSSVRVGQINAIGFDEVLARKEALLKIMEEDAAREGYDLFLLVATDILESDSIGFVVGGSEALITEAFGQALEASQINLPGIVSRKKQIIPPLTDAFDK